jgi:hypothetical protein
MGRNFRDPPETKLLANAGWPRRHEPRKARALHLKLDRTDGGIDPEEARAIIVRRERSPQELDLCRVQLERTPGLGD